MDCEVLGTTKFGPRVRRYTLNKILSDQFALSLLLNQEPPEEVKNRLRHVDASIPIFLLELCRTTSASYVHLKGQEVTIISPDGKWDELEPKLYELFKKCFASNENFWKRN